MTYAFVISIQSCVIQNPVGIADEFTHVIHLLAGITFGDIVHPRGFIDQSFESGFQVGNHEFSLLASVNY